MQRDVDRRRAYHTPAQAYHAAQTDDVDNAKHWHNVLMREQARYKAARVDQAVRSRLRRLTPREWRLLQISENILYRLDEKEGEAS